jgi:hypothetical protein
MSKEFEHKYLFLEAMIRFTEIFANEHLGDCKVDIAKVIQFAESPAFKLRVAWECKTLDDYYKLVEEMVLEGFPIWEYLKISEWTKNILHKEFVNEVKTEEETRQKKYKCYSCEYFKETNTMLGTLYKCNKPKENQGMLKVNRNKEIFEFKTRCKDFKER